MTLNVTWLLVSVFQKLTGFSHSTISRVQRECPPPPKKDACNEWWFSALLISEIRIFFEAAVIQSTCYKQSKQSHHWKHNMSCLNGHSSTRQQWVPLLNRKLRLKFPQAHQNYTIKGWKKYCLLWLVSTSATLLHDGVRIWCKHKSMDTSCLVSMVKASEGVW